MKLTTFGKFLAIAAAIAIGCAASSASAATILASWTFETSVPATAGPHAAEVGAGSALGSHAGATVYSNPAGNGSVESFSSTAWAVGDYYQFSTSTLGNDTLNLTFDATSSGTGPRDFKVSASTDGAIFSDIGFAYSVLANAAPNPVWNSTTASALYTLTTPLPAALNNQASIFLRLVQDSTTSAAGGTVASGGTSRVDNVTITGVPEPATIALASLAGLAIVGFMRRRT